MLIHHIALSSEWEQAQESGTYGMSTRGRTIEQEGFIHASYPQQVAATAARFYADVDEPLVVLVLDADRLRGAGVPVLEEQVGGQAFPHLYAPLPVDLVEEVRPAWWDAEGTLRF